MTYDYIIVGQGLCGSFLSWNLMKAGKRVLVIDQPNIFSASKVASGVINPVTGRRIVRTWEIEKLMPFAVNAYTDLGTAIEAPLIRQCNILDFHATPQMKMAFAERLPHEAEYLRIPTNISQLDGYFNPAFGVGEINPCWLIHIHPMLQGWRKKIVAAGALLEEKFEWNNCKIHPDHVEYKSDTAAKIIFCEGIAGFHNPYFKLLPYACNKGQAIIASIPDLPSSHIFKQGISIVPWKDGLFWVGASYEWNYSHPNPDTLFREKTTIQLKQWLKLPFEIVDHIAGERPANMERRPFVGLHPVHSSVGLLNGMGTKGCSLAPYFAHELAQHLLNQQPIHPLAHIHRFTKILSR
ncbi:MAG: FAD-binding oxidoreductase [Sphingobacteriia bacterium]|nr:MAG: FAD-binding oxidoreductase [Sphingobacteriia bacterium]TAG31755.1 MAG: FAD-binding oxidoreductase [Sphingobacteriia bacterium]TAH06532.1 MAG: FAD-binding oxidoreductase [Sphingobacteriia bacterium]